MCFNRGRIVNAIAYIIGITIFCFVNKSNYTMPIQKRVVRAYAYNAIHAVCLSSPYKTTKNIILRASKNCYVSVI